MADIGRLAGYQRWRTLLFVHWRVPIAALRPLVPACLQIDEFEGAAYVSLVPFVVESALPIAAVPSIRLGFLETNVRTYVHLRGREPGVYFFSLDAASLVAVLGARLVFGLPYFWAAGQRQLRERNIDYQLHRRGGRRPGCRVRFQVGQYVGTAQPDSLEHFLVERYHLHVQRGRSLWSVRVWHPPYPLHSVRLEYLEDSFVRAAGVPYSGDPPVVHFASGVDVSVSRPRIRRV